MTPQPAAEGVQIDGRYENAVFFQVSCSCGSDNCTHRVCVENNDHEVTVTTYTTQSTDCWTRAVNKDFGADDTVFSQIKDIAVDFVNGVYTRVKLTWAIWFRGNVEYQASIIMNKQTALNYSDTLQKLIKELDKQ